MLEKSVQNFSRRLRITICARTGAPVVQTRGRRTVPNPQSGPKRLDRCQPEMFSVQWSDSRWGCSSFPLTQAANFCLYMCRQWTLFLLARRPMKLLSGRDAFHCTHRKTNALRMSPLSCPPPFPMTAGSIEYKGAGRPVGSPQIATKYCDAIRSLLAFWPLSPSFQNAANCLILAEREGFYRPLRGRKLSPPSVSNPLAKNVETIRTG